MLYRVGLEVLVEKSLHVIFIQDLDLAAVWSPSDSTLSFGIVKHVDQSGG